MEKRFNKQLHGNMWGPKRSRGFFASKRARKAFFWKSVGDSAAYFLVFYLVGYVVGAGLVFYILFWPMLKALFGPLFGL